MPAHARNIIFNADEIGFYHCITRCVRRAYLCGIDKTTGTNYNHRKDLIINRMRNLAEIFFVDVGSYAVMSNHLHIVLRNRPDLASNACNEEIARRWWRLFPQKVNGKRQRTIPQGILSLLAADERWCQERRQRLACISWYMKSLAEYIARIANKEDNVTGRFWEGRFKSIALLDEEAVRNVGLYVDLNPFRAKNANSIEELHHTSVYERNRQVHGHLEKSFLAPLADVLSIDQDDMRVLPFINCTTTQYIDLVLEQIKMENSLLAQLIKSYPTAMGSKAKMKEFAQRAGLKWIRGPF